jgi:hypothetical protein
MLPMHAIALHHDGSDTRLLLQGYSVCIACNMPCRTSRWIGSCLFKFLSSGSLALALAATLLGTIRATGSFEVASGPGPGPGGGPLRAVCRPTLPASRTHWQAATGSGLGSFKLPFRFRVSA